MPINQHPATNFMNIESLKIDVVLDIGANAGQFATRIHRIIPNAIIHSFEPLPSVFPLLKETFEREGIKGKCHPFALGNINESLTMHLHVDHSPSSSILQTTDSHKISDPRTVSTKDEIIQVKRLDDIATNLGLSPTSRILIKMDVQGYEKNVILGGKNTFSLANAIITEICLYQMYHGQPSFTEMHNLIENMNFRYAGNFDQSQQSDGEIISVDTFYLKN